jgi:hypothetical protein
MNRRARRFRWVTKDRNIRDGEKAREWRFSGPLRCLACGEDIPVGARYGGCSVPGYEDGPLCTLCLAFIARDLFG